MFESHVYFTNNYGKQPKHISIFNRTIKTNINVLTFKINENNSIIIPKEV